MKRTIAGRIARIRNDWLRLLLATAWFPVETLNYVLDAGLSWDTLDFAYQVYLATVMGTFVDVPWRDE